MMVVHGVCLCVVRCGAGRGAPVRHVAEAEGDGVEVEGAVLEGQALRVPLHPRQRVADPGVDVVVVLAVLQFKGLYEKKKKGMVNPTPIPLAHGRAMGWLTSKPPDE